RSTSDLTFLRAGTLAGTILTGGSWSLDWAGDGNDCPFDVLAVLSTPISRDLHLSRLPVGASCASAGCSRPLPSQGQCCGILAVQPDPVPAHPASRPVFQYSVRRARHCSVVGPVFARFDGGLEGLVFPVSRRKLSVQCLVLPGWNSFQGGRAGSR